MTNAALLATRYARRPLLIVPHVAEELANRIRVLDERAFARPGRFQAFLRKVGLAGDAPRPMAMDDDGWTPPPPIEQRLAYAPLWAGEVEDTGYCWSLVQGVALMCADTPLVERGEEFCGVVYHGYDTLKAGIADAMTDSRVKAIFLRLDSPGGVVAGGLPELARFMRSVRAKGNAEGKPIWVYADMACSAAYWIAAQADRVLAPSVGLVGSIGAVIVHENWAAALAKEGVEVTSIQFGASKTDGAWWKALDPGAKADLQAEIDQCGRDFVADVTAGRPKLTGEALIATQARVFMAKHDEAERSGLEIGFVDAISSEEDAFSALLALVSPGETAISAGSGGKILSAPTPKPTEAEMAAKAALLGSISLAVAPGASLAELTVSRAALDAEIARLSAAKGDPAPDDNTTDDDDTEGTGGDEGEDDDGDKPDAAEAIAASAEAKAHPALALAAIEKGMTLAQFQAMAGVAPKAAAKGALRQFLADKPRLGPDSQSGGPAAGGGGRRPLMELAVADAKAKAEKAAAAR